GTLTQNFDHDASGAVADLPEVDRQRRQLVSVNRDHVTISVISRRRAVVCEPGAGPDSRTRAPSSVGSSVGSIAVISAVTPNLERGSAHGSGLDTGMWRTRDVSPIVRPPPSVRRTTLPGDLIRHSDSNAVT